MPKSRRRHLSVLLLTSLVCAACMPERRAPGDDEADAGNHQQVDAGTSDAGSADAGSVDGGAETACGTVTESGECQGNDAVWCGDEELVRLPCDDAIGTGIEGTCTVAGGFGSWCAVEQGDACAFEDTGAEGLILFVCGSTGSGLACDVDDGCIPGGAACVPPAPGESFAPSCLGSRLVIGCSSWGQKVTQSCLGDVGGTGCSAGVCTGIKVGRSCDGVRRCAEGLTCTNGVCAGVDASLKVTVTGEGRVTSSPEAIDCPGACAATGPEGAEVSLTAAAAEGWAFDGWSGGCEGDSATIGLELFGATTCTATFVPTSGSMSLYVGTGGRVTSSPAGFDCRGSCTATFELGQQVTLTAVPDENYRFVEWDACTSSTEPSITLTVNGLQTCTATFEAVREVPVVVVGPGRVTSAPAGIDCPGSCEATFRSGRSITLAAVADEGARFVGWTGRCSGTSGSVSLYVASSGALECTATFEEIPRYDLTVSIVGDGEVASSPAGIACPGDCTDSHVEHTEVELTATPAASSRFVRWTELPSGTSGGCQGTDPTTTVTMSQARSCRAEFVPVVTATVAWRHSGAGRYGGSVAWKPDGSQFATFYRDTVRRFDPAGLYLGSLSEGYNDSNSEDPLEWNRAGTVVATAGMRSTLHRIRLTTLATGEVVELPVTATELPARVSALAWNPDGTLLAGGLGDGSVRIWNVATHKLIRNWNASTAVTDLAWSPDGAHLATTSNYSDQHVRVWSTSTWAMEHEFDTSSPWRSLSWSADSSRLAGPTADTFHVWSPDGSEGTSWAAASCRGSSFNPDGTRIASVCAGLVTVWDVATGSSQFTSSGVEGTSVRDVQWSPTDSVIVASYYDGSLRLIDGHTGAIVRSFNGPDGTVNELAYNAARDELYGVSEDGLVYAVDASTGAFVRAFGEEKFSTRARSVTVSSSGDALAAAVGSYVHEWATATGVASPRWYAGSTVIQMRWSANDVLATSLYGTNGIGLWPAMGEASSATLIGQFSPEIAWHPGARYLASTGARTTQVWDSEAGVLVDTFQCPGTGTSQGYAVSSAFSPDGARLATSCTNGPRLWNVETGEVLNTITLTNPERVSWRPGSNAIALTVAGKVHLLDASTGGEQFLAPLSAEGSASSLAWSADGSRLFVGSTAGTTTAWDVAP